MNTHTVFLLFLSLFERMPIYKPLVPLWSALPLQSEAMRSVAGLDCRP